MHQFRSINSGNGRPPLRFIIRQLLPLVIFTFCLPPSSASAPPLIKYFGAGDDGSQELPAGAGSESRWSAVGNEPNNRASSPCLQIVSFLCCAGGEAYTERLDISLFSSTLEVESPCRLISPATRICSLKQLYIPPTCVSIARDNGKLIVRTELWRKSPFARLLLRNYDLFLERKINITIILHCKILRSSRVFFFFLFPPISV